MYVGLYRVSSGPGNDLEFEMDLENLEMTWNFGKKILKTWNFVEVDFICTKVSKY